MTLFKSFKLWVFVTFVVLGLIALALWLDLRRQKPSVTMYNFSVPPSPDSEHHLYVQIHLRVKNPNKVRSIIYDNNVFTVYYGEHTLAQTQSLVELGFQKPKEPTDVVSHHVEADFHQWKALRKALSNSLEAMLKAEFKTEIQYQEMGHKSKKYNLTYQGQFKIGSDGNMLGEGKKKLKLCERSC